MQNPATDNLTWGKSNSPLIVNALVVVSSHDPADGTGLWQFNWPGGMPKVSQPVAVAPDKVFLSAGYGLGAVLLRLIPGGPGEPLGVEQVWNNRNMKTKLSNVAVRDGFVYGLDEGILACLELATGARRWKDGRYGHGQLLLVDDVLLLQTEPGSLALVRATPDGHSEIGRWHALTSKTWNNPTLAPPYLLLRNDREALCLLLPTRIHPATLRLPSDSAGLDASR